MCWGVNLREAQIYTPLKNYTELGRCRFLTWGLPPAMGGEGGV